MKIVKYLVFAITTIILIGIFSFKNIEAQNPFLPTKLKITVLDRLGNVVPEATVTLYKDESSYRANADTVQSMMTDEKGVALFKNLEPVSYFIDARKGDENNDGEGVQTASLQEGRVNKVNTIIE
ncbi:carboxypeptidase-like regulatory domain-containing protein [Marinoscillum sp. MHG1-6]|uniref:carboxypeptidase-like regulatory domain-containing protein n=1 Tax=Marinoscillum sp. MHG1-6 TaxID=2959627 RepID=UPI002158587C|nr:carboxypeptidase-like regulatory domain-containing protein [Marinoscillum sp. MHG1-6]